MAGWIKLYRTLNEHMLWSGEPYSKGQAWVDILLWANHKDSQIMLKGQKVVIKRGQQGRSIVTLVNKWKWSRNKVVRFLKFLKTEHMIDFETNHLTTTITICNFDRYQDHDPDGDTADDTAERTPNETSKGHHKDIKRTTVKNERMKECNNKPTAPTDAAQEIRKEIWTSYCTAYNLRYGTKPVRNARVNTLIKQLHDRLGVEAVPVVAYYVQIEDQFYCKQSHSLGPLLQNAEGIATQWRIGGTGGKLQKGSSFLDKHTDPSWRENL